jgi:hypothetical protein
MDCQPHRRRLSLQASCTLTNNYHKCVPVQPRCPPPRPPSPPPQVRAVAPVAVRPLPRQPARRPVSAPPVKRPGTKHQLVAWRDFSFDSEFWRKHRAALQEYRCGECVTLKLDVRRRGDRQPRPPVMQSTRVLLCVRVSVHVGVCVCARMGVYVLVRSTHCKVVYATFRMLLVTQARSIARRARQRSGTATRRSHRTAPPLLLFTRVVAIVELLPTVRPGAESWRDVPAPSWRWVRHSGAHRRPSAAHGTTVYRKRCPRLQAPCPELF